MRNLTFGTIYMLIAYTCVWFQAYGTTKIDFLKSNKWIAYVVAVPITYFFIEGTRYFIEYFNGSTWSTRLVVFAIDMIIFTCLSYFIANEAITLKNAISLALCFVILSIQMLM